MIEEVPITTSVELGSVPGSGSSELGSGLRFEAPSCVPKDNYEHHPPNIDSGFLDPSDAEEVDTEDELSDTENGIINNVFVSRENEHKLRRRRNLLVTKLHHLRKDLNILVIGPDNAGKTSLINSLGYMINQDEASNQKWRNFADYDLGKTFKYKEAQVWPLDKKRSRHAAGQTPQRKKLTFFEASGLQKCGDLEKSATILQYILEGRITTHLLQMFLLMTTEDITSRYCDLATDPPESLRVHAIVHCTAADQAPNKDLIKLVRTAMAQSNDPRVKKMPIMTCVTSPHTQPPVVPDFETSSYDMSSVGSSGSLRRNSSTGRLTGGLKSSSYSKANLCEPRVVRELTYYAPDYNPITDESETANIYPDKEVNTGLLQLFDDILRVSQRDNTRGRGRRFFNMIMEMLN